MKISKEMIKEGLTALGIKPGMKLMVHSSLKSFGEVENGADTVLDALFEIVTEEGTIMMPSFNHGKPYNEGDIYDPLTTPTVNGLIPETFRKRKGVSRSINPTHPFAAWGKNHEYYLEDHQKTDAFGIDSPLHRLMKDDGYCLLLGVGYLANTFHHCVETCENVPCLCARGEEYPVRLPDGQIVTAHTWAWRNEDCHITDTAEYGKHMAPIEKKIKIGNAEVTLYKLSEGYKIIADSLKSGIGTPINCGNCKNHPRVCEWSVKKD